MNTDKVKAIWNVYVRKGIAVVPNVAQTEAGYYLDVGPTHVSKLDDIPSLAAAIEKAMTAGNPRVPTPARAAFPKPVVLKPARAKSWKELEKTRQASARCSRQRHRR